ncbi:MAG: 23S rRNA (pseudouridine(1915)-N(3))-methyltransferase RlmH [Litoreibacter sp.]|uniref:23S rRNA (pseudouridine(1915)-N(3))-methyltransferase RlmH n=1 Tax=Litoreibacter sp. TaxID=1969459 RepID=UPI003296C73C
MRVTICAIGRLRAGPELDLIKDYLQRFDRTGRNLGLGPAQIIELEDKKGGGSASEAILLQRAIPKGAKVCTMDERGKVMTSPEFANMLGNWRDQGTSDLTFVIGGADGLTKELRAQADTSLSFGKMVWPHMLARAMLTEQLYRAASILSGSPYHRV